MTSLFIILFIILPLFAFLFLRQYNGQKAARNQVYKVGEELKFLTKADILEMSRKNYGVHSWYGKTRRK